MQKVISIGGQLASGKDTLADYLALKLNNVFESGHAWERMAFANAVKDTFQNAFGVDRDFIEKWKRIDEAPPGFLKNIRQSLQFIGDGFRQIRDEIWIEVAFRQIGETPCVISDCRYINEAIYTKKQGGLTVAIWRPGFENDDPNPSEAQIKPVVDCFLESGIQGDFRGYRHELEAASHFDFFIRNDGTIEDLYKKADEILIPEILTHFNLWDEVQ